MRTHCAVLAAPLTTKKRSQAIESAKKPMTTFKTVGIAEFVVFMIAMARETAE
jgi:hypothetical protein